MAICRIFVSDQDIFKKRRKQKNKTGNSFGKGDHNQPVKPARKSRCENKNVKGRNTIQPQRNKKQRSQNRNK